MRDKFEGGVLGSDGCIYCIPLRSDCQGYWQVCKVLLYIQTTASNPPAMKQVDVVDGCLGHTWWVVKRVRIVVSSRHAVVSYSCRNPVSVFSIA